MSLKAGSSGVGSVAPQCLWKPGLFPLALPSPHARFSSFDLIPHGYNVATTGLGITSSTQSPGTRRKFTAQDLLQINFCNFDPLPQDIYLWPEVVTSLPLS